MPLLLTTGRVTVPLLAINEVNLPANLEETTRRLHERADTVTPLLLEILRRQAPSSRWGINE